MIGDRWPLYLLFIAVAALFTADGIFNWSIFTNARDPQTPRRKRPYSSFGRIVRGTIGGFVLLGMIQGGLRELFGVKRPAPTRPLVKNARIAEPPVAPSPPAPAEETQWIYEDENGVSHTAERYEWVPANFRSTARPKK
jgi:hypothetical protein